MKNIFYSDKSVAPQLVRDWAEEQLREAIFSGKYNPGEWLRQNQVAKQFGISEIPVREALKKLAAEGLVEYLPYRGMRVKEYLPDDVKDIYKIRAFMEGMAANIAAKNITSEELDELESLINQMENNLGKENLPNHRELNHRFHEVIFSASRRAYIIHVLRQLWLVFPSMMWGSFSATATDGLSAQDSYDFDEHRAILRALKDGKCEQAELVMRLHIEGSGDRLFSAIMTDKKSLSE